MVVIAAGNSKCDACLQTPAFAPHAITVGASSKDDRAALFSDYGKCINVYAPGELITSACASALCNAHSSYVNMTGTSMAAPFVSGVMAQILQSSPGILPLDATDVMTCIAARGVLDVVQDELPTVTRNLLLQSPRHENLHAYHCALEEGCPGGCSGNGVCLSGKCFCDTDWWGDSCHTREFGQHCSDDMVFIPFTLYSPSGEVWKGADFRISAISADGNVEETIGVLDSSMCGGRSLTNGVCLETNRVYGVSLSTDSSPSSMAAGYQICGQIGGAPSAHLMKVMPDGGCYFTCPSTMLSVRLNQLVKGGWRGAIYQLMDSDSGVVFAGGTLVSSDMVERHVICPPHTTKGISLIISRGLVPLGGAWQFCDHEGLVGDDFALFERSHSFCRVIQPSPARSKDPTHALGAFDYKGVGWRKGFVDVLINVNSTMEVYDLYRVTGVSRLSLLTGAANQTVYAVPSRQPFWHLSSYTNDDTEQTGGLSSRDKFWIGCGTRGLLGETIRLKPSSANDLVGSSCTRDCLPLSTSPARLSNPYDLQLLTITRSVPPFDLITIQALGGSVDLCLGNASLPGSQSCYRAILGGGSLLSSPSWQLCGQSFSSSAVIDICVRDWTHCSASLVFSPTCSIATSSSLSTEHQQYTFSANQATPSSSSGSPLLIVLFTSTGAGWQSARWRLSDLRTYEEETARRTSSVTNHHSIRSSPKKPSTVWYTAIVDERRVSLSGTLLDGSSGFDSVCLPNGCYVLETDSDNHTASIAWLLCGHIGKAGETFFFQLAGGRCLPLPSPLFCRVNFICYILLAVPRFYSEIFRGRCLSWKVFLPRWCSTSSYSEPYSSGISFFPIY